MNFNADIFAKLRDATSLLQTEGPMAATAAIQRALQGMSMPGAAVPPNAWANPMPSPSGMHDINPRTEDKAETSPDEPDFLTRFRKSFRDNWTGSLPGMPEAVEVDVIDADRTEAAPGRFTAGAFANSAGRRAYKLYVPSSYRGKEGPALPLIVMLHGCKQNPDDFAAGTNMNQLAEEQGCLVLYPAQAQNANGSNCWNWFQTGDQQRGRGEPSIIAEMTQEIMRTYHVDPQRVYVAGLSAGGAMAAVMANTYPELFAAVGLHSGLPHGAAHDVMSAFAAMRNGMPGSGSQHRSASANQRRSPVPAIVFHGDRDTTVHPRNSDQALAQCMAHQPPKASRADTQGNRRIATEKGTIPGGRAFTKVMCYDDDGSLFAEQWTIHGAGHAWSGGSSKGSYTDPKGPDASLEMLRFFMLHKKA
ncbi:poly(hydroxyalkanoate) depolymerase family esterase [Paucimonas lemoignei]|uniref:Poly(Hydroxyalkanoate) depolymerase family esterase n=1 Tax=Paucimonas lemoignei TaxID=29443 RepID=A0A4R3HW34_PAULE|nr:PHB depolymerase family esterase [Paucimonas lemoignei]TCS36305.1 poly(hydroxyalkanoate) depolymerase family esterase [Paucimonas lemoignei]